MNRDPAHRAPEPTSPLEVSVNALQLSASRQADGTVGGPEMTRLFSRPMPRFWAVGITLVLAVTAVALSGADRAAQAVVFESPEQVLSRLRSEKAPSRTAGTLGIESCGRLPDSDCSEMKVEILRPRLDNRSDTAVLKIEGTQHGDLVVLMREGNQRWVFADTLPVTFPYKPMNVEFRSVVAPPVEEIVVHNNAVFWGNAYLGHLLIVKLVRGRLQVVFSAMEEEYARMAQPFYSASSTFELKPGEVTQTARYAESDSTNDKPSFTITRQFVWNKGLGVFLPGLRDEMRREPFLTR
jgi:hypothetical protein